MPCIPIVLYPPTMPPPLFTGVGCESPDGCVLIVSPPRLLPFRVASPDVAAELGFLWLSFDRFPFVFAPVKSPAPPVDGEVSACARAEASAVIPCVASLSPREPDDASRGKILRFFTRDEQQVDE
mmetsp:Transcript_2118/g.4874  ORF Transcript_2118/g.4874 Transcript_2118/m.4874 type:complete len:125 (-) Transcript_2118:151-525(-)